METTVTNGGPMAHASQLAEKAARAVGDGETAAVELAAVSLALSLADLAGSARTLAERAAPQPVPTPVPLASADTLPDDVIDAAMQAAYRTVHAAVTPKATSTNRETARALVDAVNARLRAQFPDETPLPEPAAPFVRGVDELTDDEIDEDARGAWPWSPLSGFDGQYLAFLRDFATAVAARLRVDGPPRSPAETADVVTAEMLDAAEDCARVADYLGSDWTKRGDGRWGLPSWAPHTAATLISTHGPLSNLRPPSQPAKAEPERDQSAPTFDILISAALHYAAEWAADKANGMYRPSALAPARSNVDQAAREHVAALGPGPVITAFAVATSDEDVVASLAASRAVFGGDLDQMRAALLRYAERLADRAAGGYDPEELAPGSVVVAGGRVFLRSELDDAGGGWVGVPVYGRDRWIESHHVPTDGVLVVDGATLGGQS